MELLIARGWLDIAACTSMGSWLIDMNNGAITLRKSQSIGTRSIAGGVPTIGKCLWTEKSIVYRSSERPGAVWSVPWTDL